MLCPSCNAENSAGTRKCGVCGEELKASRRRRNNEASAAPLTNWTTCPNRAALSGYRCSVYALIPFLGLVLGPVAVTLGIIGLRRARRDPNLQGTGFASAAIIVGAFTAIANWVGLLFLIIGVVSLWKR